MGKTDANRLMLMESSPWSLTSVGSNLISIIGGQHYSLTRYRVRPHWFTTGTSDYMCKSDWTVILCRKLGPVGAHVLPHIV